MQNVHIYHVYSFYGCITNGFRNILTFTRPTIGSAVTCTYLFKITLDV